MHAPGNTAVTYFFVLAHQWVGGCRTTMQLHVYVHYKAVDITFSSGSILTALYCHKDDILTTLEFSQIPPAKACKTVIHEALS